jgi:hypothetical protein
MMLETANSRMLVSTSVILFIFDERTGQPTPQRLVLYVPECRQERCRASESSLLGSSSRGTGENSLKRQLAAVSRCYASSCPSHGKETEAQESEAIYACVWGVHARYPTPVDPFISGRGKEEYVAAEHGSLKQRNSKSPRC